MRNGAEVALLVPKFLPRGPQKLLGAFLHRANTPNGFGQTQIYSAPKSQREGLRDTAAQR